MLGPVSGSAISLLLLTGCASHAVPEPTSPVPADPGVWLAPDYADADGGTLETRELQGELCAIDDGVAVVSISWEDAPDGEDRVTAIRLEDESELWSVQDVDCGRDHAKDGAVALFERPAEGGGNLVHSVDIATGETDYTLDDLGYSGEVVGFAGDTLVYLASVEKEDGADQTGEDRWRHELLGYRDGALAWQVDLDFHVDCETAAALVACTNRDSTDATLVDAASGEASQVPVDGGGIKFPKIEWAVDGYVVAGRPDFLEDEVTRGYGLDGALVGEVEGERIGTAPLQTQLVLYPVEDLLRTDILASDAEGEVLLYWDDESALRFAESGESYEETDLPLGLFVASSADGGVLLFQTESDDAGGNGTLVTADGSQIGSVRHEGGLLEWRTMGGMIVSIDSDGATIHLPPGMG
ncbi:hypothetical protein FM112_04195 [Gulosibacter sp. 10]|nr:hypothetical protein FM112_04195 [Gulosibacter sp. 10]